MNQKTQNEARRNLESSNILVQKDLGKKFTEWEFAAATGCERGFPSAVVLFLWGGRDSCRFDPISPLLCE
jgi:hypothetical protein